MTYHVRLTAAAIAAATLVGCRSAPDSDPRMVSEWMHTLYGVVRAERLSPPVASRFMAYAAVAVYQGLAAASPELPSLAGAVNGLPPLPQGELGAYLDGTLVAVAAERAVLDSLLAEGLPTTRAAVAGLSDSLERAAGQGVRAEVATRSSELGKSIGLAIVAWSRTDGFDSTRGRPYAPAAGAGFWLNDSPASLYASQNQSGATELIAPDNPSNTLRPGSTDDRNLILNRPKRPGLKNLPAVNMAGTTEPYWGQVRPFMLKTWNECPVPDPPAYGDRPDAPVYREAMGVYQAKKELTPEQRSIALYWADNPGETATPSGHWTAIASQMVSARSLSAAQAARLFAASAMAQSDAFVAAWGYKFKFNLIRPRTFIRRVIDPGWEPLIPTPPFPEHPAGHSTQSAAAATVLTAQLGNFAFDDSTGLSVGHPVRHFESFTAAAHEAGQSRIYGGIHFQSGNLGGRALGECIGTKVAERMPNPGVK